MCDRQTERPRVVNMSSVGVPIGAMPFEYDDRGSSLGLGKIDIRPDRVRTWPTPSPWGSRRFSDERGSYTV